MEDNMIRLFEIFREVVASGSISAAAKTLHISQPAISVAIRDLETHYHCQLFERVGKRLIITEQGIWLYGQINVLLEHLQHIEDQLQNKKIKQRIRLGASLSVGATVLSDYIKKYNDVFPQNDVQVRVEHNETIEQRLVRNECDLALIEGICGDDRVERIRFIKNLWYVWHQQTLQKRKSPFLNFLSCRFWLGKREVARARMLIQ